MAYASVADLRAEGVTTEQASDQRLQQLIDLATSYVEAITGLWFEERAMTLRLDGTGSRTLWLPIFPTEVSTVRVDGRAVTDYVAYNRFAPDDRRSPRLVREVGWPKGRQNIEVDGRWGYVDPAPGGGVKTPEPIRRAVLRLVVRELPLLTDVEGQEDRKRTRIVSETTDGHSYTLERLAVTLDLTGDPDIDGILAMYRRPIAVGSA